MKITNIEKFRTELYDNLAEVMFAKCTKLDETRFERSHRNGNMYDCCALYDCLEVSDFFNSDRKYYVTICGDESAVIVWKLNKGDKAFTYDSTIAFDVYNNKTQFMMAVAVSLQRAMMNH